MADSKDEFIDRAREFAEQVTLEVDCPCGEGGPEVDCNCLSCQALALWRTPVLMTPSVIEAETLLLSLTEKLLWYADEKGAIQAPQIRRLVKEFSVSEEQ